MMKRMEAGPERTEIDAAALELQFHRTMCGP
jgi:hypothetical protein